MNHRRLLIICSVLGVLAVSLGAFGAHGLKELLPIDKLETYSTGIDYHFYHTIALLFVAILLKFDSSKWFKWSSVSFIIGIVLFSGSLYLLATRAIIGLTYYQWLGPITPLGGVFFIIGWVNLGIGAFKLNDKNAAN